MGDIAMWVAFAVVAVVVFLAFRSGWRARDQVHTGITRELTPRQFRRAARARAQAVALEQVDQRARRELPEAFGNPPGDYPLTRAALARAELGDLLVRLHGKQDYDHARVGEILNEGTAWLDTDQIDTLRRKAIRHAKIEQDAGRRLPYDRELHELLGLPEPTRDAWLSAWPEVIAIPDHDSPDVYAWGSAGPVASAGFRYVRLSPPDPEVLRMDREGDRVTVELADGTRHTVRMSS